MIGVSLPSIFAFVLSLGKKTVANRFKRLYNVFA